MKSQGQHVSYHHLAELPVEEVLPKIGNKTKRTEFTVDGKEFNHIKAQSTRLNLFKLMRTCVECGLEGNVFCIDVQKNGNDKAKAPHLNLYHKHEDGDLTLMTKDHIIPHSMGGLNIVENMQVMCEHCNLKKSDEFRQVDMQKLNTKVGRKLIKRTLKEASPSKQKKLLKVNHKDNIDV